MSRTYVRVTAYLSSPLCGDAPMLDAILFHEMAGLEGKCKGPVRRDGPALSLDDVHIPVLIESIGRIAIPHCSGPILAEAPQSVERFAKRFAVEHAELMAEGKRNVIATGNGPLKSYRLPLQLRHVSSVTWFAVSTQRQVKSLVRRIRAIGHKRSQGFGRVDRWKVETIPFAPTWWAETERGKVLMRPLPLCDELPQDLIGSRPDFGSVSPPYWHPDRYCERVVPC